MAFAFVKELKIGTSLKMHFSINNLRQSLDFKKGQFSQIQSGIAECTKKIAYLQQRQGDIVEALTIIQTVAQSTQSELEYHISELVTLALAGVFPDPPRLCVDFVMKRNKTEADIYFDRGDAEKIDPLSASGGGLVDIASFALRVSLWSMQHPRLRNTLILDEPLKFLNCPNRELQEKAVKMIKEIGERLNIQFIIVSLLPEFKFVADKIFEIVNKEGVSEIK